jgi:hypothetical protein
MSSAMYADNQRCAIVPRLQSFAPRSRRRHKCRGQFETGLGAAHQFRDRHRDRPHNVTGVKGRSVSYIDNRQGGLTPIEPIFEDSHLSVIGDRVRQRNEAKKFSHDHPK